MLLRLGGTLEEEKAMTWQSAGVSRCFKQRPQLPLFCPKHTLPEMSRSVTTSAVAQCPDEAGKTPATQLHTACHTTVLKRQTCEVAYADHENSW